jgi:hypothetical protein
MEPLDRSMMIYWVFPVSCIPQQLTELKFYYSVIAKFGHYNNINDARIIGKPRSHYTVFRYLNFRNDFVTGSFYFAQQVFCRLCNKELTLKDSLEEYDQICFGYQGIPHDSRVQVAKWIQQELAVNESCIKAVFFAHVIQHFDDRLLHNTKKNRPLLKELIQDDSAMLLINLLLQYDMNEVKHFVPNVKHLVSILLGNVTDGVSFEYAVGLCFHFGVDILEHLAGNANWSDQEDFLLKDELYAILHSLNSDKDRNRLLGFIVKKAPSISFTWTLYNGLLNSFPPFVSSNFEMFKKTCNKHLSSRQAGKLPTVLQKASWQAIPENFKADFVGPFLEAIIDQIRRKSILNADEENAVIAFFTDEIVLSNKDAKAKFLDASKSPEMHQVVINVLQNPNSLNCWSEAKEEIRSEVYNSLIRQALSSQTKPERDGKSKVLRVLESLHEIFIALDVCPCDKVKDETEEKCLKSLGTLELIDITKEFEKIEGLHSEVEDIYFLCLRSCIDREIKRDNNHANIVEVLKKLSTEEEGKKNKLERYCWLHDKILEFF